ncbi:MAG TPA: cytochrome P450, partial [Herpetosiphonaceae bacterium]
MTLIDPLRLAEPALKPHAYGHYANLRRERPLYRTALVTGAPLWMATRYADVVAMFKDERFVKDYANALTEEQRAGLTADVGLAFIQRNLLFVDPPDHTRLRALVSHGFTPARIEALRPRVQQIADELIAAMPAGEPFDLIDAFAFPLPIMVISEMLGVPHEDQARFRAWSNLVVGGASIAPDAPDRLAALREFGAYNQALIERRRAEPCDDLVSLLVQAEEQGDRLTMHETIAMIFLLIVAGHETTVNLLANGVLALLTNPAQRELLLGRPELIKNAVEEFLRFDGPVETTTMRFAREDIEWDGNLIRRGERVLLAINSADRDPEAFENPDDLDITRQIKHHLAFGH